jgi:hypothetical protein
MMTMSIATIIKCMNPQCDRVIVIRGAQCWAGPEVPSERIHKVYNSGSLPFSVGCACGHYTISVMANAPGFASGPPCPRP